MNEKMLVEKVYEYVERNDVNKAVFACLRLARSMGDVFNVIMFLRELYPDSHQFQAVFSEETKKLKDKSKDLIWNITQERWVEERSLSYALGDDGANVLAMGVGELINEVNHMRGTMSELDGPAGNFIGPRRFDMQRKMRLKTRSCLTILDRIRTRCLNYANRIESQIDSADKASNFVATMQNDVHNYYAHRSASVYEKLRKASELIGSSEGEDYSLVLTSVRRAVKAVADYHYPPVVGVVECADGKDRKLGGDQYINRILECLSKQGMAGSSGRLLQAELRYFGEFLTRLNEIASKGVHADVSCKEARQGLLGLYMFLSNFIAMTEGA